MVLLLVLVEGNALSSISILIRLGRVWARVRCLEGMISGSWEFYEKLRKYQEKLDICGVKRALERVYQPLTDPAARPAIRFLEVKANTMSSGMTAMQTPTIMAPVSAVLRP